MTIARKLLASLFSLEICGYAVMSNHVHLILHMQPDHAKKMGPERNCTALVEAVSKTAQQARKY